MKCLSPRQCRDDLAVSVTSLKVVKRLPVARVGRPRRCLQAEVAWLVPRDRPARDGKIAGFVRNLVLLCGQFLGRCLDRRVPDWMV